MKRVLLLSDFKIPEKDISFILKKTPKDTLELDSQLRFSYGGIVETDKSKLWIGDQSRKFAKSLRLKFHYPEFNLIGMFLDKALIGYADDPELTYGVYHNSGGERVFVISSLRRLGRVSVEKYYGTAMHEIGESKGLKHHNNPNCFMHDPYIPSETIPSGFCSECLSKVKHKNF